MLCFHVKKKNFIDVFLLYIRTVVNCIFVFRKSPSTEGKKINCLDQTFLYLILKKYVKKVTTALSGIFVMLFIQHYNTNCNNRFYNLDDPLFTKDKLTVNNKTVCINHSVVKNIIHRYNH